MSSGERLSSSLVTIERAMDALSAGRLDDVRVLDARCVFFVCFKLHEHVQVEFVVRSCTLLQCREQPLLVKTMLLYRQHGSRTQSDNISTAWQYYPIGVWTASS